MERPCKCCGKRGKQTPTTDRTHASWFCWRPWIGVITHTWPAVYGGPSWCLKVVSLPFGYSLAPPNQSSEQPFCHFKLGFLLLLIFSLPVAMPYLSLCFLPRYAYFSTLTYIVVCCKKKYLYWYIPNLSVLSTADMCGTEGFPDHLLG